MGAGYWPPRVKVRPSWWNPEKVLELLRNGEPAPDICRRAAAECGNRATPTTIRRDITAWTESASMGNEFEAALALYARDDPHGANHGRVVLRLTDAQKSEFLAALDEANGVIEDACASSCLGEELVYALLDKRNKKIYDADFAERVRTLEGRRIARVRQRVLREAENPNGDSKVALKVLETSMPSLHGNRQQIEVSGEVDHKHAHAHVHALSAEVVAASAARLRALTGGHETNGNGSGSGHRLAALPESLVVDGELVADDQG